MQRKKKTVFEIIVKIEIFSIFNSNLQTAISGKKEQLGFNFQWILTTTRSYLNAVLSVSFVIFLIYCIAKETCAQFTIVSFLMKYKPISHKVIFDSDRKNLILNILV